LEPDVRQKLLRALRRDAIMLAVLYLVPGLRRWRQWYWRLTGAALVVGAVWGLVVRRLIRSGGAATATRVGRASG
jgi:hypothetical protein